MSYKIRKLKDVLKDIPANWHSAFRAVRRNTNDDEMIAIYEGYIGDGSASAFIYYVDTVGFFRKHRIAIMEILQDEHEQIGDETGFIESISRWPCIGGKNPTSEERSRIQRDVIRTLAGAKERQDEDFTIIKNGLTWGAVETISCYFVEED